MNRRYTDPENKIIRAYVVKGKPPLLIAKLLGRSLGGVEGQIHHLRQIGYLPPRPALGLCRRCGERPRKVRPSGGFRSWCGPCESAQKADYQRTPAGKAAMRRYVQSEKGRAARNALARRQYWKNKRKADSADL